MKHGYEVIAREAGNLAKALPDALLKSLSQFIASSHQSDDLSSQSQAVTGIAHPHHRSLVANFLRSWQTDAKEVGADEVAMAIETAAACEKTYRDRLSVEPVWTGPDIGEVPFRRTRQALLQLIDSATDRLLVVSYAVYNIPLVRDSLIRAFERGVAITVVVETPDRLEGKNTYNTLQALGSEVTGKARVYYWPPEKRERDEDGKSGILHVKCAVADGKVLFLSSANLTQYTFTVNMELGLLVTGGRLPSQIERQFQHMIQTGVLARP